MKKSEVKIGEVYRVKVSGNIANVRITGESPYGGWDGINVATKRKVRIKSAQRLRGLARQQAKHNTAAAATGAKEHTKATKEAAATTKRDTGERDAKGGEPVRPCLAGRQAAGEPGAKAMSLLDGRVRARPPTARFTLPSCGKSRKRATRPASARPTGASSRSGRSIVQSLPACRSLAQAGAPTAPAQAGVRSFRLQRSTSQPVRCFSPPGNVNREASIPTRKLGRSLTFVSISDILRMYEGEAL